MTIDLPVHGHSQQFLILEISEDLSNWKWWWEGGHGFLIKGAQCSFGEDIFKRRKIDIDKQINKLISFSWLNKQTDLAGRHSFIPFYWHVADPATCLASNSVLGPCFPPRTTFLLAVCIITSVRQIASTIQYSTLLLYSTNKLSDTNEYCGFLKTQNIKASLRSIMFYSTLHDITVVMCYWTLIWMSSPKLNFSPLPWLIFHFM